MIQNHLFHGILLSLRSAALRLACGFGESTVFRPLSAFFISPPFGWVFKASAWSSRTWLARASGIRARPDCHRTMVLFWTAITADSFQRLNPASFRRRSNSCGIMSSPLSYQSWPRAARPRPRTHRDAPRAGVQSCCRSANATASPHPRGVCEHKLYGAASDGVSGSGRLLHRDFYVPPGPPGTTALPRQLRYLDLHPFTR